MSLSDPQSVTINAVAQTLARVSSSGTASVYQKDDATVKLSVSHQFGKRKRTLVRLDFQKIAVDPLLAVNQQYSMSVNLTVDRPLTGFTVAEQKQIVDALTAYLTASSGANTTKILGSES